MGAYKQSLLEDGHRLDELHRIYDVEAQLKESFIVLTIGAGLIRTLVLLSNNATYVIGAMLVDRGYSLYGYVFDLLSGSTLILFRSLETLSAGAAITVLL